MMLAKSLACLAMLFVLAGAASAEAPLFPFIVSYDAPDNVTNVSAWLDKPAGKHGFVRAVDGKLAHGGGPARLWATNLCFDACFPDKAQAERVAARLARLGINCVRMHHMDSRSIWGKSPNKLTIDPDQLDRLDFLIYQLKQHGVYTNLNLHVSRWFGDAEGFSGQQQRPHYDKGLDNFEPRMIDLQKKYARDLLTHVNPYTKTAYVNEPAVAVVEINNENALFNQWNGGELDELPEPYATTYRKVWNEWLKHKYGDTAALKKAWNAGSWPLGENVLVNGDFSQPLTKGWSLERDAKTRADLSAHKTDGRSYLKLVVKQTGEVAWHPQLVQSRLAVKKGQPYTLSFRYRGDVPRTISANCMMAHAPWERLGLSATAKADTKWKDFSYTFLAERDDDNARISFNGFEVGTHELTDVAFRPGGVVGLADNERLEDQSVRPMARRGATFTVSARADFADFMRETEKRYWVGMYRYLKDELGLKSLVIGTQLGYGPTHIQAALDYLDDHSYWQHPHFPGKPWDMRNWNVRNTALVNSAGGTLASLASQRVADRPYTVSEYNHPYPNQYAAEGFPMIAAFGAFQGWDGVYSFAYCHNDKFESSKIESFFDIKSDPTKIAHMPACAAMFLRGDVAKAKTTLYAPLPVDAEVALLRETLNARTLTTQRVGLGAQWSMVHAIGLDLDKGRKSDVPEAKDVKVYDSDTGQIRWDLSRPGEGMFTVDSPRSKLFTGFPAGRAVSLGNVGLSVGATRLKWATVSMTCIDAAGFDQPGRILLVATGVVENTGLKIERLRNDQVTIRGSWGTDPILCEGVPARVTLPVAAARVKCYPLDGSGKRQAAIAVSEAEGKAVLPLGPECQTIWYEVEIR